METVALLGNGCSITYNPELAMGSLTRRVLHDLTPAAAEAEAVAEALHRLAEASTQEEEVRVRLFEDLLGPLERVGRGLDALGQLAQHLEAVTAFSDSLRSAQELAGELRRRTLGVALDVVGHLSAGQGPAAQQAIRDLIRWLYDSVGMDGTARVFTLNYDALVDGAAIEVSQPGTLSDMAEGHTFHQVPLLPGVTVPANPLRDDEELTRRMTLYHLHGSLQWVRRDATVWKVGDVDFLRVNDFWNAYANGEAFVEPSVILADQKVRAIEADPFRWAYRRFESSLLSSDGLLIAGYGFGDLPVNRTLNRAIGQTEYPVLCVARSDEVEALRESVLEAIPNLVPERLLLHANGIEVALPDLDWGW